MARLLKYLPNHYQQSIFEIDFLVLQKEKIKVLMIDLDNTLVPYDVKRPSKEVIKLLEELQTLNFTIIIMSNNSQKRVAEFLTGLPYLFVAKAHKPLKKAYRKALKLLPTQHQTNEIAVIGDQIITDVLGGNKMDFYTILVDPILKQSDVWTTKFNRFLARRVVRKIAKRYPNKYQEVLKDYAL